MLRNDDIYPTMIPTHPSDSPPPTPTRQHANNDFDDIFGSAPPSPSLLPSLDAISDTERGSSHTTTGIAIRSRNTEPSEVPRLRSAHSTAGYREGLAAAKNSSIQAGFDEGYSLGATVGSRVGVLLGVLEGIAAALEGMVLGGNGNADAKIVADSMRGLVVEARRELKTESVFGPEYWGKDGVWIYKIPGEDEGKEVTWKEVVDAHPLVNKWEGILRNEAEIYGISLTGLEGEDEERDEGSAEVREKIQNGRANEAETVLGKKKGIDW